MFDGLQNVLERCTSWYEERLSIDKVGRLVREDSRQQQLNSTDHDSFAAADENDTAISQIDFPVDLPAGVQIYITEPITDRKSAFVGRACRIQHPSEVASINH